MEEFVRHWTESREGMEIPHRFVGAVMGNGGAVIRSMTAETGAVVDMDVERGRLLVKGSAESVRVFFFMHRFVVTCMSRGSMCK